MSSDQFIQHRLQEDPKELENCLKAVKKLLEETPPDQKLELDRNDDEFLKKFIRAERYNIQMTVKKIYAYQKFRNAHPQLKELNAFRVGKQLEKGFIYILPNYDKKGRTVCYIKGKGMLFGDKEEGMKWIETFYYLSEKIVQDEHSQIDGVLLVCDAKYTGWKNFSHRYLNMIIDMFQGRSPCRVGQFCFVREPNLARILWRIASPFLSQRFKARLRFVGENYSQLEDILDLQSLPKEVGGQLDINPLDWLCDLILSESENMTFSTKSSKPIERLGATVKFEFKWVVVVSVNPGDFASEIGLKPDDMILSVNGIPIKKEGDLNEIFPLEEFTVNILRPKPI